MKTRAYAHRVEGTSALLMAGAETLYPTCRMIGFSEASAARNARNASSEIRISRVEAPARKKPSQMEVVVAFVIGCIISFGSLPFVF